MVPRQPAVGAPVHYVSYGTPGGEYRSECRAAIITEVTVGNHPDGESQPQSVGLCVLNPEGLFFNRDVGYDNGTGQPASPACGMPHGKDSPFRYCACGWTEPSFPGGTWHWPAAPDAGPE